jgi:hypothetical protein
MTTEDSLEAPVYLNVREAPKGVNVSMMRSFGADLAELDLP